MRQAILHEIDQLVLTIERLNNALLTPGLENDDQEVMKLLTEIYKEQIATYKKLLALSE